MYLLSVAHIHFQVITFGWICCCIHPKVTTGQLTRGAFIINDFLRNPHFNHIPNYIDFQTKNETCVSFMTVVFNQMVDMYKVSYLKERKFKLSYTRSKYVDSNRHAKHMVSNSDHVLSKFKTHKKAIFSSEIQFLSRHTLHDN